MTGVSKKKYFCLFQPDILTINYRCLEDFLLIFGPSWAQNTILPKKEKRERESQQREMSAKPNKKIFGSMLKNKLSINKKRSCERESAKPNKKNFGSMLKNKLSINKKR